MRTIHPFPARMAPDTVAQWLNDLPGGARVLDPMCGSGVVVRQSALLGLKARGFDIDPLAVLMSKVWTRKGRHGAVLKASTHLLARAKRLRHVSHLDLPSVGDCAETQQFIEYWFAEPQRSALVRLSRGIELLRNEFDDWICDCLQLALSRIIITKHTGASLAWDVSHSRPHRVRTTNDYDVLEGYRKGIERLVELLDAEPLPASGTVDCGDCRDLCTIKRASFDAVVTSPPYLNAIDYLRGHKLALVWMGYGIPRLREIRSGAVGTERAGSIQTDATALERAVRSIKQLPRRQRSIVHKYACDAELMVKEARRVLAPGGIMVLVVGDSNLRGSPVYNSKIFKYLATENGFVLSEEKSRRLQANRRYLPISSASGALANRMKTEVLQAYRLASSA